MITIVLTYRNRSINIVKKCLDSLETQENKQFKVALINYGSSSKETKKIESLLTEYSFIKYTHYRVSKQLWNKSKALNIALKQCETPYFFVGDIDMMYRNNFVEKLYQLKNENKATYFQVGFLNKEESLMKKQFNEYKVKHFSTKEATGMTLYPKQLLEKINGFDEFYHGWGSEDTDVHIRLQNAGYKIDFYTQSVLLLHQWHSKIYRSKDSIEPFHSNLEQINQQYLQQVISSKRITANEIFDWGKQINSVDFDTINIKKIELTNLKSTIDALLLGGLYSYKQQKLVIKIKKHTEYKSAKNILKRVVGKKYFKHYHFQELNNKLLAIIIADYRMNYYEYKWDQKLETITLKVILK